MALNIGVPAAGNIIYGSRGLKHGQANSVGDTPPPNSEVGVLWVDTTDYIRPVLRIYKGGGAWAEVIDGGGALSGLDRAKYNSGFSNVEQFTFLTDNKMSIYASDYYNYGGLVMPTTGLSFGRVEWKLTHTFPEDRAILLSIAGQMSGDKTLRYTSPDRYTASVAWISLMLRTRMVNDYTITPYNAHTGGAIASASTWSGQSDIANAVVRSYYAQVYIPSRHNGVNGKHGWIKTVYKDSDGTAAFTARSVGMSGSVPAGNLEQISVFANIGYDLQGQSGLTNGWIDMTVGCQLLDED